jgi:phosphoribosylglycinamide formyltransferase 2
VTLVSQDLSEFALHARAILDLPIPAIRQHGPAASSVILVNGESNEVQFCNLETALANPDTQLRLFGKPEVRGSRRMGVALALGDSIEQARKAANTASAAVKVSL